MKRTCGKILFLFLLALFSVLSGTDLDSFIGQEYQIFQSDRPRFIDRSKMSYFAWTSDEKNEARYPVRMRDPNFLYLGLPVQEVLVKFQENSLKKIYVSIYNRGDASPISGAKFRQLLLQADQAIRKRTGIRIDPPVRKERIKNAAIVYARVYRDKNYQYVLKWSSSGTKKTMKPEYVQIELTECSDQQDSAAPRLVRTDRPSKPKSSLKEQVKQDRKGNVWVDGVPMVDQGQKGYCAAAVAERVLRYYGSENVTQHTIAQLAKTEAAGGTSTQAMLAILKKTENVFRIKVDQKYHFPANSKETERFIKDCARVAKKEKKRQPVMVVRGNMLYINETVNTIDPEIYLKVRLRDTAGMKHFLKLVRERTDAGFPTVWGVMLGIVPEDKLSPQSKGGHMRLIIGYNATNREIIYTDTWGMGHEFKTMPEENAWAITTSVLAVDPRGSL